MKPSSLRIHLTAWTKSVDECGHVVHYYTRTGFPDAGGLA